MQRAYYPATQDAVSLVTSEQLPTTQLLVHTDGKNTSSGLFVLHPASLRASTLPEALSSNQLQQLGGILTSLNPGGAFWPYADIRREALVASWFRGDYRSAVLAAATAAEVLLDTVLLHMLWVEGVSPEEAATVFKGSSLTKRVKRDSG